MELQNKDDKNEKPFSLQKWLGLFGGLFLFILMLWSDPPEGLGKEGWVTAAVAILMAIWWISEAIPIPATALLPLVLFPLLEIANIKETVIPYSNPIIFLFMGGFIIAIAMQEWGLHKRIALNIIRIIGHKPKNIILGFMIASAFISMWVSNTAATIMMLPIALSVIEINFRLPHNHEDVSQYRNFSIILMLGIAYASNVGGIGTIIGTPTNALLIGFLNETYGIEISFLKWLGIGLPIVFLGLPIIYFTLVNILYPIKLKTLPAGKDFIKNEIDKMGKISKAESMVAVIFTLTAILWLVRPFLESLLPGISDPGIAIFAALLFFITPLQISRGKFLLSWKAAEKLPWGILILFGGGLTLAGSIQRSGLADWIGGYFTGLHDVHIIVIILIVTVLIIMFTELTSNVATVSAFLPIMVAFAAGMGEDPLLLAIPVAIAASCAFMLPVATPPNAIVYGSGLITIPQMVRAGFLLNLFFALLITVLAYFVFAPS